MFSILPAFLVLEENVPLAPYQRGCRIRGRWTGGGFFRCFGRTLEGAMDFPVANYE